MSKASVVASPPAGEATQAPGDSSSGSPTGSGDGKVLGAFGFSRGTKGSGQSLMGSRHRALTSEQLRALAAGEFEMDNELDGGDVLMEVLAEDSRGGNRRVEFADEALLAEVTDGVARGLPHHFPQENANGEKLLPPPKGPRAAQRHYLTHEGVRGSLDPS